MRSIAMWPGRSSWKDVERKRDYSILAGRMLVDVKHANWRKAQAAPMSRMARNQAGNSGGFQESGSKRREPQRKSGSGKEALSRTLSVKACGTEETSE